MPLSQGRAYGVWTANTLFRKGDYTLPSTAVVTADSSTTQAGGTLIEHELNLVSSGGTGYSVVLPVSSPGMQVTVVLTSATNTCKVYPNAGGTGSETINALSANAAITMAATTRAIFVCGVAGAWYTIPLLPS